MPGRTSSKGSTPSKSTPLPRFHSPLAPITPSYTPPSLLPATPSLMQSVKDGIGLGIGSAIGHRIVGSLFGSSQPASQPPHPAQPTTPCQTQQTLFDTCIKERKSVEECQHTLDQLNKCLNVQ